MTSRQRSRPIAPFVTAALAAVGIVVLAVAVAVGGSPGPAAAPSDPLTALGSPSPNVVADASSLPSGTPSSAAPTASPKPTPSPTAKPASPAVWSTPTTVKGLANCWSVVAAIDDRGVSHLAAVCGYGPAGSQIRYAVSNDARTWKTTAWAPPLSRLETDPQLAISGKKLYLAYTRLAPVDGGCGDDGLEDVGVYYRARTLPSGAWSKPIRIGDVADHLQSFRVSGAVLHATVVNETERATVYETVAAGALTRYPIGDAVGGTSLRIGDDGKARIAYESTHGISYGMVKGGRVSSATIPNSANGWAPALTLGPGNVAYVMWTRSYHGLGCAEPGPDPEDGTYVATNASGTWISSRMTPLQGATMTLDAATGELHAVVRDRDRIVYFHRPPGGDWAHETAVRITADPAVIRVNPRSGALFVAVVNESGEGQPYIEVVGRR